MDCWSFLKIEPTKDEKIIKRAYSKLLPVYHPEKDHEGFMKLRQSYEEALTFARSKEEENAEKSPVDIWIDKVDKVYKNFANRLSLSCWQTLLDEDVCVSIDSGKECSDRILIYIAEHIFLPHEVLKLLDDFFLWSKKKEQLYQVFPPNYIDYICANAKYEDDLRFSLLDLTLDIDYDQFLEDFFFLEKGVQNHDKEVVKSALEKLQQYEMDHPDLIEMQIRGNLLLENVLEVEELCQRLLRDYKEEERTIHCLARTNLELERYEEGINYYNQILEKTPDYISALIGKAACCKELGRCEEAICLAKKAQKKAPYDGYIRNFLVNLHESEIASYKSAYEANTEDNDALFAYCKVLAQAYHFKEAVELIPKINRELVTEEEYCKLCGKAYMDMENENCEKAIPYLERLIELQPEKINLYEDLGYCYGESNRLEEAKKIYEQAKTIDSTSPRIYYRLSQIYIKEKHYEQAIDVCNEGLKYNDQLPNLYHFKAEAYFYLHQYDSALQLCDHALAILPYVDTYEIKTKILNECQQFDQVISIVEELEKMEFISDELLVQKAIALRYTGESPKAKEIIEKLIEKDTNIAGAYYQRSIIAYSDNDIETGITYAKKAVEKAKEYHEEYYLLLNHGLLRLGDIKESLKIQLKQEKMGYLTDSIAVSIGDIYLELQEYSKAETYLKKALKINPQNICVYGRLCDVYLEQKQYDLALEAVEIQLKREASDYYYIDQGIIYGELEQKENAMTSYKKALEMNPTNCYAWSNIAFLYREQGKLVQALEHFIKSVEYGHPSEMNMVHTLNLCARLQEFEKGEAVIKKFLPKYKKSERVLLKVAKFYHEFRIEEKAEQWYNKYGEITEDKEWYFRMCAEAMLECGNLEKGLFYYNQALKLPEKTSNIYKSLGEYYDIYESDIEMALKYYKKSYKMYAEDGYVCFHLGALYKKLGKDKKAKLLFEKSLELRRKEYEENDKSPCNADSLGVNYAGDGDYDHAMLYLIYAIGLGKRCEGCARAGCYEAYYDIGDAMEQKAQAILKGEEIIDSFADEKFVKTWEQLKEYIAKLKIQKIKEVLEWDVSMEIIEEMERTMEQYVQAKEPCDYLKMALEYYKKALEVKPLYKFQKAYDRVKELIKD